MKRLLIMSLLVGCGGSTPPPAKEIPADPQPPAAAEPGVEVAAEQLQPDAGVPDASAAVEAPLAKLDTWTIPKGAPKRERGAAVLAQNADAQALMMKLSYGYLDVDRKLRVTGLIEGPRDSVRAALIAKHPDLATGLVIGKGKGRKVDLNYIRVESRNVFRLLADVYGVNVIFPPKELPPVHISVRAVPVDALIRALADRLGLSVQRHGKTTMFMVPQGTTIDSKVPAVGRKIDVQAQAATAGETMAAVAAVANLSHSIGCDAGQAMEWFEMRRAPIGSVLTALAFAANVKLTKGVAEVCQLAELKSVDDTEGAKLTVIASAGPKAAGVVRLADGQKRWFAFRPIGPGYARLPNGKDLSFWPEFEEEVSDLDEPWWKRDSEDLRLAATVSFNNRVEALIEGKGMMSWLRDLEARNHGASVAQEWVIVGEQTLRVRPAE